MRVSKFIKSVRYCLTTVNTIFMNTGLILLLVGVFVFVIYKDYEELITQRFFKTTAFVIATGVIIVFVSILGYYAAISEQFYAIVAYLFMMVVMLIFEISIIIVSYGLMNDSTSEIRSTMTNALQQYGNDTNVARLWDEVQRGFECCGVISRFDWHVNRVPVSCCHIEYGTISPFNCTMNNAYSIGCGRALGEWLGHKAHVMGVTAIVTTCIQVLITGATGWITWISKYEQVELES